MKKALIIILVASLSFLLAPLISFSAPFKIVNVCNGYTLEAVGQDITIMVALAGINKGHPFQEKNNKFLRTLLLHKVVDIKGYGLGTDDRNLGVVRLGDTNINLEMVRQGMAKTFCGKPPSGLDLEPYLKAEHVARLSKRGIWKNNKNNPGPVTVTKKETHML
ncbi:thermonuclease family protein [Thermodesulfobacteriota bacterium]